jgi:hypothetical protein
VICFRTKILNLYNMYQDCPNDDMTILNMESVSFSVCWSTTCFFEHFLFYKLAKIKK